MEWVEALVLGVVQGLTEFLPVSSDGHLAITQQVFGWLRGRSRTGAENLFFDVMLHLGTLAAIIIYYRTVVRTGKRGLFGSSEVPPPYRRHALVRTGLLVGIATLPLVPDALFLKDLLEKAFESTVAAGIGFLITAAVLSMTGYLAGGEKGPAETTWRDALLIGIAQMFAPLPGVSRSGLTVATALALGFSRAWAVGFSLLMAVPAILGAVVFELRKVNPSVLTASRVAQTAFATMVAGLVGYGAIIWLVKVVRSGKLWCFSVYLVVLGAIVLAVARLS
jgi:undecaprenyl-diphosphatase